MARTYDVNPEKLIEKLAEELKNVEQVVAPEWALFVKTGTGKERPPLKKDWWYMRTASVLRKVYMTGPIGVSKLRKKYSSKKNRGHKPERVYPGSGNILRKILQQLEKAELVKYIEKGVRKGRIITSKGEKLLNKTASSISGTQVIKKPKIIVKKVEENFTSDKKIEETSPKEKVQEEKNESGRDKGTEAKGDAN
jgi:small subunit ribosomal protein S19e